MIKFSRSSHKEGNYVIYIYNIIVIYVYNFLETKAMWTVEWQNKMFSKTFKLYLYRWSQFKSSYFRLRWCCQVAKTSFDFLYGLIVFKTWQQNGILLIKTKDKKPEYQFLYVSIWHDNLFWCTAVFILLWTESIWCITLCFCICFIVIDSKCH